MRAIHCIFGACLAAGGCALSANEQAADSSSSGTGATTGPSATTGTGPSSTSSNGSGGFQAGTLTAGVWDDNRNYDFFTGYVQDHAQLEGALLLTDAERAAANALWLAPPASRELLDIALVIDTTGSMGDELVYLQTELDALTTTIGERYPLAEQRWAIVVYRDQFDAYVTETVDFQTDLQSFQQALAQKNADGGGDYPEASDAALASAMELEWRAGSTARLLFWLADAPHHTDAVESVTASVRAAAEADIHIYPIAASGVDELAEHSMRSAAQLTGGRYIFLTDDSGIGDPHKEPTIPCYYVTRLDRAILRMVDIEMTGIYKEPHPDEIIRTGGDPEDGRCQLESGGEVLAF